MSPSVIPSAVAAAAFWIFLAVIIVGAVFANAFRHRETQKTIRQAIERGQALDPQILEGLLAANRPPPPSRNGLLVFGLVLVCLGVGFALMGWFGSQTNPGMLPQALGVASLIGMLGVALLIASLFVRGKGEGRG